MEDVATCERAATAHVNANGPVFSQQRQVEEQREGTGTFLRKV